MAIPENTVQYRALKCEAREACERRGHVMSVFKEHEMEGQTSYYFSAHCIHCAHNVFVSPDPAPGDIDIRGEAVAVYCPGKGSEK